jgi:hypothetical protein
MSATISVATECAPAYTCVFLETFETLCGVILRSKVGDLVLRVGVLLPEDEDFLEGTTSSNPEVDVRLLEDGVGVDLSEAKFERLPLLLLELKRLKRPSSSIMDDARGTPQISADILRA